MRQPRCRHTAGPGWRAGVAILLLGSACWTPEPPAVSDAGLPDIPRGPSGNGERLERCSAGTVERRPLILAGGLHAYVEPTNLMRMGSELVVVGSPTYTWEVGGPSVRMATQSEHIAAYVDADPPRLVDRPLRVPLDGTGVRGVPLGEGRWGVLLPEKAAEATGMNRIVGLWYAEYDGARWSDPEPLPLPGEHDLFVGSSSALVDQGDAALAWAVLDRHARVVQFYERVDGTWRFAPVPDSDVEATALAHGPSGTWLALSGLDPAISGPTKSVRLYRREDGWRLVRRDPTSEPYTEIQQPHVMDLPGGVTLTWTELRGQGVVFARVGLTTTRPGRLVVVDEQSPVVRPFATGAGSPAWVVQHSDVVGRRAELRVLTLRDGDVHTDVTVPYPYTGFYAASAAGPDQTVVTGAEFDPDPSRPTVRSLTLRLNPSCQ